VDGALSSMVVPDQGVENVRTVQEKVREKIMALSGSSGTIRDIQPTYIIQLEKYSRYI